MLLLLFIGWLQEASLLKSPQCDSSQNQYAGDNYSTWLWFDARTMRPGRLLPDATRLILMPLRHCFLLRTKRDNPQFHSVLQQVITQNIAKN